MHFLRRSAGIVVRLALSAMLLALVAGMAGPTPVATSSQTEPVDPAVQADLAPTGELRVAINLTAALAVKDPVTGDVSGVTVDLVRELAARLGVPLAPGEYVGFPRILRDLQAGELDVGFIAIVPDRAAVVDFTAPYMELDDTYLVPPGSLIGSAGQADQPGVRIVVIRATAQDVFLTNALAHAELVRAANPDGALEQVRSGEVHAFAWHRPNLLDFAEEWPGSQVLDDRFSTALQAIAIPQGRPAGLAYVTEFVDEMKASGFVQRSIDRHGVIGVQVAPLAEPAGQPIGRAVVSDCGSVQVFSSELTLEEAEEYCRYALAERAKVEEFWGPTWLEPIRIHVDSSYPISRALIPAYSGNRGFMEMPLRRVRTSTGALLHEIVHIYAPADNRLLAEGLAVYLQDRLGGNPAVPNFGRDLDDLASELMPADPHLEALNTIIFERRWGSVLGETAEYALAGSFVGFLIEEYGLEPFRRLYDTGDYDAAYGKPLPELELAWREWL